MRFAYPVLQERVRVTDEARRARARRGGDGLLVPFGELIDSRLGRHGVDPAAVRWDAYRREDGGWTVTSQFSSHERTLLAKFSFALLNRTVSALDDIAADLLSDRPAQALLPPPPPPEPVAEDTDWASERDAATPPPRLTAVPNPSRAEAPRPRRPARRSGRPRAGRRRTPGRYPSTPTTSCSTRTPSSSSPGTSRSCRSRWVPATARPARPHAPAASAGPSRAPRHGLRPAGESPSVRESPSRRTTSRRAGSPSEAPGRNG